LIVKRPVGEVVVVRGDEREHENSSPRGLDEEKVKLFRTFGGVFTAYSDTGGLVGGIQI
jgi:hypothetical protein